MTRWKRIDGYRHPYRIREDGEVQRLLPDGSWRTLKPQFQRGGGGDAAAVLSLKLAVYPDGFRRIPVVRLMEGRFIRPREPGAVVTFRNHFPGDVRADNLMIVKAADIPGRLRATRRPVKKVDRYGSVLGVYGSIKDAARENFFSVSMVKRHLHGAVKDRYRNGYTFVYDN